MSRKTAKPRNRRSAKKAKTAKTPAELVDQPRRPAKNTQDTKPEPGTRAGTPNAEYTTAEAPASRCAKCGSTNREHYDRRTVQTYAGIDPAGRPYTRIIRRWTKCTDCGQHRIDRTYENDSEPGEPAQKK